MTSRAQALEAYKKAWAAYILSPAPSLKEKKRLNQAWRDLDATRQEGPDGKRGDPQGGNNETT